MTDASRYQATVDGQVRDAATASVEWVDREAGVARIELDGSTELVLVEGSGSDWTVTLRGRRVGVTLRTWRERMLVAAETASIARSGPTVVAASLPGLVVAVAVAAGDEVEAGASLLTIEAMKMQNEVRAPRAGRVVEISVASGEVVATGAALLRLE